MIFYTPDHLPMFFGLKTEEIDFVCSKANEFFGV
jgi:dTDP-4-amino-4,6-dideoxygalactose transaminase